MVCVRKSKRTAPPAAPTAHDLPRRGRPLTRAQEEAIDLLAEIYLEQLMSEEAETMMQQNKAVHDEP